MLETQLSYNRKIRVSTNEGLISEPAPTLHEIDSEIRKRTRELISVSNNPNNLFKAKRSFYEEPIGADTLEIATVIYNRLTGRPTAELREVTGVKNPDINREASVATLFEYGYFGEKFFVSSIVYENGESIIQVGSQKQQSKNHISFLPNELENLMPDKKAHAVNILKTFGLPVESTIYQSSQDSL